MKSKRFTQKFKFKWFTVLCILHSKVEMSQHSFYTIQCRFQGSTACACGVYFKVQHFIVQFCAVFYSILHHFSVFCSMLQYVTVFYSILQYVTVFCSILQYFVVFCSILQCISKWISHAAQKDIREECSVVIGHLAGLCTCYARARTNLNMELKTVSPDNTVSKYRYKYRYKYAMLVPQQTPIWKKRQFNTG